MARLCTITLAVSCAWVLTHADDDTEAMVQRVANVRRHRTSTPDVAPICTAKELAEWIEKANAVIEEDWRQEVAKSKNETHHAIEVLRKHLEPLVNATLAANQVILDALKPALKKIIMFGLQNLMKRKVRNTSLIDFNATVDELTETAIDAFDPARVVFLEGLRLMDEQMNASFDALPQEVKAVAKKRAMPTEPDNVRIAAYLDEKVLPILIAEMFPKLAEPLVIWAKTPNTQPEFDKYVMDEVVPFIMNKVPKMMHQEPKLPDRDCVTCHERYEFLVNDMGSLESCMAFCVPLVPTCKRGVSNSCLKLFEPCLTCHTEKLAQLDECEGTHESSELIRRITLIRDVISGGTVKLEGIDDFLTKLSETIVD